MSAFRRVRFGRDARVGGHGRGCHGWLGWRRSGLGSAGRTDFSQPRNCPASRRNRRLQHRRIEVGCIAKSQTLSMLIRHEQAAYAQAQQSAACFAPHQVQARLCRWLLRARDLAGTDLHFTKNIQGKCSGSSERV